eukprot:GHUV01034858.1.p1 GENE.GHUV01034858.1~~GHUV01034858.1.p1  ORF type:complete len:208 (+),score=45.64 GHUV01034858.1:90-626(+)
MGGALAVWAAATKQIPGLEGVVVIDVVGGTALAALPHMMGVLHSRPVMFQSLQAAVDWAVRSGMCKNREMAGVSLVSQLVQSTAGDGGKDVWTWRTPLAASRQYWEGWYTGLSDAFLALPVPKVLLLAGTDRWGCMALHLVSAYTLLHWLSHFHRRDNDQPGQHHQQPGHGCCAPSST